jgi:hypothetical protein
MSNETQQPLDHVIEELTLHLAKSNPDYPWQQCSLFAQSVVAHLRAKGFLLPRVPPQPDEPELPLDDGDTIAGHIDLSALSTPPKDRDADWFEQVGLK